jgi:hypothetical protein
MMEKLVSACGHSGGHSLPLPLSFTGKPRTVAIRTLESSLRGCVRHVFPSGDINNLFGNPNIFDIVSSDVACRNPPEPNTDLGGQDCDPEMNVHPTVEFRKNARVGFSRLEFDQNRMVRG